MSNKPAKHNNGYIVVFVVITLIVSVLSPIIIQMVHKQRLSPDGLLSYLGALLGGIISLFIAYIGIKETRKATDKSMILQKESFDKQYGTLLNKRLAQIKPFLELKINDGYIYITNYSEYPALNCLIDSDLFENSLQSIVKNEEIKIAEIIDNNDYPSSISLIYRDVDGNMLAEDYKMIIIADKRMYELSSSDYEEVGSLFNN